MGTDNSFYPLKEYATKLVSFKQGVHIDALSADGQFLSQRVNRPRGACLVLTTQWLEAHINPGSYQSGFEDKDQHRLLTFYGSLTQHSAMTNEKSMGSLDATSRLLENYGLKTLRDTEGTLADIMRFDVLSMTNDQGALLSYGATENENHAVGLYKKPGQIFFFDANIGSYEVRDYDNFWPKYLELCQSVLHFRPNPPCACRILKFQSSLLPTQ